MAKPETETQRQRTVAIRALQQIRAWAARPGTPLLTISTLADNALREIERCDNGLFGDHSQLDLADRKDLKP